MVPPSKGPGNFHGKGSKMTTVNEEKKTASHDTGMHKQDSCASIPFEGKVVSMTGNRLVMTSKEGKECSHTLAKDAKVTCDGAVCKAETLKPGTKIRVTTLKDDKNVACCVESLDKQTAFAHCE